jgi:predicted ABC-type exoprotein transport system permease subunit
MNEIRFFALILSNILNPVYILGSFLMAVLGSYLVLLITVPLGMVYVSWEAPKIKSLAVLFNLILLAVLGYFLYLDITQLPKYYVGFGLVVNGLLSIATASNIILLTGNKNA